ncbi:hypothetical protein Patl_0172 [Paraglaciecola sp. T6c]|uniref:tetratricopeptide repeat protein n=1 Tax=Pseudoalteromonas atlantica (strain T6c / ATCC BAA-1087) TaxID=3042615 RepID=UPI00005C69B4|nr:tetratricopeptide repeat protein [Paraglaciecola sp. T6c]ABG38704.1 hypothetical protein Patl_0172 [Paraglaciecola sp. T6c]
MSVVNKMLQDLEARQTGSDAVSADYQPPQRNTTRLAWLILLMVIALLFAAVTFMWPTVTDDVSSQDTSSNMINPALRDIAVVEPTEPDTPAKGGMTWLEPADKANIDLSAGHQKQLETNSQMQAMPKIDKKPESQVAQLQSDESAQSSPVAIDPKSAMSPPYAAAEKVIPPKATFSKKANRAQNAQAGLKQSINQALRDGKTLIAIEGLQQLLSQEPDNLRIRKKLASLLFAENRMLEAQALLSEGLADAPELHDLRLMLARLFAQQNQQAKALTLLLEVSPSLVLHSDYYAYRGALAQQTQNYAQAQQDYQRLVNAEPRKAKWWLGLGIAQDSAGENKQALMSYQKADDEQQLSPQVITFVRQRLKELVGIE